MLVSELLELLTQFAVYVIILVAPALLMARLHRLLGLVGLGIGLFILTLIAGISWFALVVVLGLGVIAFIKTKQNVTQ